MCGEREFARIDRNAITNPTLLVEVTSQSTEDYDRGEKLGNYQQGPSLRALLFVSHRRKQVTLVSRPPPEAGTVSSTGPGQRVGVGALGVQFSVDELYAGIALEEA